MNKQSKKDLTEKDVLLKALSYKPKSNYAKSIHKLLFSESIEKYKKSERPDFIYSSSSYKMGIEHCLVDTLLNKQNESFTREQNNKHSRAIDEHNAQNKNLDFAADYVAKSVESTFDAHKRFSYKDFIDQFEKICMKHEKSCKEAYRIKLPIPSKIVCLIELPYHIVTREFDIQELNGVYHKQRLNKFPITLDMKNIIESMKDFDYVAILTEKYVDWKDPNIDITYFEPNNINESIKEQCIHLYKSFDYSNKASAKIKVVDRGDRFDYFVEANIKKRNY